MGCNARKTNKQLLAIVLVIYLPRSSIIQNVSDIQDITLGECSAYAEDKEPLYKLGSLDTSLDCGVFCFEKRKIELRYTHPWEVCACEWLIPALQSIFLTTNCRRQPTFSLVLPSVSPHDLLGNDYILITNLMH